MITYTIFVRLHIKTYTLYYKSIENKYLKGRVQQIWEVRFKRRKNIHIYIYLNTGILVM